MMNYLFLIVLVVLLFLQAPVWVSVGSAAFVGFITYGLVPSSEINSMMSYLDAFTLLAVPFYIYAGNLMSKGSIAKDLLRLAQALSGGKRESLATATLLACAFFAAICGSSVVTVAALGPLTIPMMASQGYKKAYASAIVAAGAIVGPIIPPSLSMVIYGVQTKTSITDMFIAGVIPGIMMTVSFIIVFKLTAKNNIDYTVPLEDMGDLKGVRAKLNIVWQSKWAILMPVIILGGIYGGIMTPTEAAVVACSYALIVDLLIQRDMTVLEAIQCIRPTMVSMGAIMLICAVSNGFGQCLTLSMIPQTFTTAMTGISSNNVFLLMVIVVVCLIAGCFMEGTTGIIILTPILLPLASVCGLSSLEFGVVICVAMTIGTITPPFGVNLFVVTGTSGESIVAIIKKILPFIAVAVVDLLILAFLPQIISFLPKVL